MSFSSFVSVVIFPSSYSLNSSSSVARPDRVTLKGFKRAFADSCNVWLKHQTWLSLWNILSNWSSFIICVSFKLVLSALTVRIFLVIPNTSNISWNAFAIATLVCDWQYISSCRHSYQFGIPPEVYLYWEGMKACHPHTPDEPSMPQTHDGSVTSMHLSQHGDNQDAPVEIHIVILMIRVDQLTPPA